MSQQICFANGTTALAASIISIGCKDTLVAVPASVCPSVVAAVFASGNEPYFVDIEEDTLGICPRNLEAVIADVGAIIAVHAYGNVCNIAEISAIARRHSVPLIEDCAQAEGAKDDQGMAIGVSGNVSVYSYGAGKILDIGGGGLAITEDRSVAEAIASYRARLPHAEPASLQDDLSFFYKMFYNRFFPDRLTEWHGIFIDLSRQSATNLLRAPAEDTFLRILAAKESLDFVAKRRRDKWSLYESILSGCPEIKILEPTRYAVPWRFNVWLEPVVRDRVLRLFLSNGKNISSWYPDISLFVGNRFPSTPTPVARWLGAGILNLWLDDTTDDESIENTCSDLKAAIYSVPVT